MSFDIILIFAACGVLSGTLSGLLGIGGGIVTVPVLYYTLTYLGYPDTQVMQTAITTSLAATFVTTFASTWAHHQKRAIEYSILKYLAPGLLIGCISGAAAAHLISAQFLRIFFGSMATLLGCYFFFPKFPHPNFGPSPNYTLFFFGILVGCLSSLLGIGGGIFTVPILLGYHVSMMGSVATSSAATLFTAFAGSLSYLYISWKSPSSLPDSFSTVDIPAFLAISLTSSLLAPVGVKLSQILPTPIVKRIFALALAATGITMLLRT